MNVSSLEAPFLPGSPPALPSLPAASRRQAFYSSSQAVGQRPLLQARVGAWARNPTHYFSHIAGAVRTAGQVVRNEQPGR